MSKFNEILMNVYKPLKEAKDEREMEKAKKEKAYVAIVELLNSIDFSKYTNLKSLGVGDYGYGTVLGKKLKFEYQGSALGNIPMQIFSMVLLKSKYAGKDEEDDQANDMVGVAFSMVDGDDDVVKHMDLDLEQKLDFQEHLGYDAVETAYKNTIDKASDMTKRFKITFDENGKAVIVDGEKMKELIYSILAVAQEGLVATNAGAEKILADINK